jgi:hypothetical protein
MERHESYWKEIQGSEPVEIFGYEGQIDPEPVKVDLEGLIQNFKIGFKQFSSLWREIFCKKCFSEIQKATRLDSHDFHLSTDAWIRILYELAATFHAWSVNRNKLIDLVTPLYYARVASFVRQSWEMSTQEADDLVEEQAQRFEERKDYLIKMWDKKAEETHPS